MLGDDGSLGRGSDGRWVLASEFDRLTIPPSISALITARLDRLGISERTVIEHGAVFGQVFFLTRQSTKAGPSDPPAAPMQLMFSDGDLKWTSFDCAGAECSTSARATTAAITPGSYGP